MYNCSVLYLSRIGQARSPPNHSALLHLSSDCTQHPLQDCFKSTHLTSLQCPVSFVRSGLFMLLQRKIDILTFLVYLPPVIRSNVHLLVCLRVTSSVVYSGEVCAIIHPAASYSTNSCKSKNPYYKTRLTRKLIHWTVYSPAILHSASIAINKHPLLILTFSFRVSFHNRRPDPSVGNMSAPDPFQELVDSLRWVLLTTTTTTTPITTVTNTSTSSSTVFASPMARPAPFSGAAEECNGFLLQCSLALEMQPHLYTSDRAKIAFIISLLTGRALQWAETICAQASTVTQSLPNFKEHFLEVFGRPVGDSSVGEQLYHLRQVSISINDYTLKFRTLAAASGWNERSLLTTYRQGLEPRLRLQLAAYDDSCRLERFIQLSIYVRIGCSLAMRIILLTPLLRRPEITSNPEPGNEPMQIDTNRLSSAERQRRLTQGLCLYCGAGRHIISSCPIRPPQPMGSVIKPAIINMQPLTTVVILTASNVYSSTCPPDIMESLGYCLGPGTAVHIEGLEGFLLSPRCDRKSLIRIPSSVERVDGKEDPGSWTLPTNLLPWPLELLEPVPRLGRVHSELPPTAFNWTHSLPVHTLLPAAPVPLVWGTVRCSVRRLLVPGEREGLGCSSPSAPADSAQTEDDSRPLKIRSSIIPTWSEGLAVNTGHQDVPALQEAKSQICWPLHHHQANKSGHLPTATSSSIKD